MDSNGLVIGVKVGSVTITATTSNGKIATCNITVQDYLSNVVNIGDYVAYDAGTWASSASLPTSQGEFGGYTKGQNKANSVNWCYKSDWTTSLKGWRVLSVDKNTNTVTIVHAGHPECYHHAYSSSGYSAISVTNLNNRAVSTYLNNTYASSAYMMKYDEALSITGDENSTNNSLRTIGDLYWLASPYNSSYLWLVDNGGGIYNIDGVSVGVRPVVVLKSNIRTTGKTTDVVGQVAWDLITP